MDLSTMSTASKRLAELDSLYAWSCSVEVPFTQVLQKGIGYKYKNHKALMMADENEIYVYKQTVKLGKITNGLTLVTKNSSKKEVKKFFTESIKKIKASEKLTAAVQNVESPIELGIRFGY